jgi:uncharacterized protein (TIGR03000 family)
MGCYGGCMGCAGGSGCCGGGQPATVAPRRVTLLPTQATVVVQVADDASLTVNGERVPELGSTRTFISPELTPGRDYYYTIKMERPGGTVTDTKRVYVRAGQTTRVDFTRATAAAVRPAPEPAKARVTVRLPADARLTIDDVVCPLTSATRTFETPPLEPGRPYYYTLRAEVVRDGKPRAESQRVSVQAGKEARVDFQSLEATRTASR